MYGVCHASSSSKDLVRQYQFEESRFQTGHSLRRFAFTYLSSTQEIPKKGEKRYRPSIGSIRTTDVFTTGGELSVGYVYNVTLDCPRAA